MSFQSLHRREPDSAKTSLTMDMDKSYHGCDQNLDLKKAYCSNKGLKTVPQNLSGDTKVLDLSYNIITKLLNSSFKVYPLINSLDISFNDIRVIESAAFYPLKGLMNLSLFYNQRIVLPATSVFMMSSQLSFLDLTETNLTSLPNDTLKWSPHLDTVILFRNRLSSINVSSCGMHANIVIMTSNQLKHLTAEYFTFVCHTDILDLRDNPIQSVDPDVIASLHVRFLNLGACRLSDEVLANIILGISKSDIEGVTIQQGSVGAFPEGFFDPLNPFLSFFPPAIFRQLSVLQELNLEYCAITNLHPLVFSGLESLQKLSLEGNNIQHIHDDALSGLGQINSINFKGNQIEYLGELMFSNKWKVTNLSLADNKLTHLNRRTFKPIFSSISLLDISMNPIDCNCDLKWLIDWINKPIRTLIDKDKTICSSESLERFREKPLLDVDPNELCIINGLLFLIPLASIGLVVISVLLYHYRWQLRYKLFLLKLAAVGYKEMRDARDHNEYEFDVNIIFYDDDEEWIREQLRPALEERLPQFQRNVCGDDDLVLGMHYLDSVDYVVSHSYKTIIVLSRAAVQDRWFILKFRTAMDHVSDTLTEFVVVVFLEDIPDDEMPFLARLYLNDGRPYIHWTEDMRGQEYFWDELTKTLTINLRTNDLIPNE
ncbi:slit homolog 1 protein-like [Strongylocentrotus purpuratus]|uniref:TIR domain-containing protein n=1 Tax=Strongylocentrotus purpuratus TaxID=7668 RepID=A0A7M7PK86_STRPU|nr:slit homolog 1 protein-like [Strongylocentrotus purpuratus]